MFCGKLLTELLGNKFWRVTNKLSEGMLRSYSLPFNYNVMFLLFFSQKFSPCSLRTIGATLAVRAPICFVSSSEATLGRCGNRRLDPGEECDAGAAVNNACCTPVCKLRPGAQCSPWNHDCCTSGTLNRCRLVLILDIATGTISYLDGAHFIGCSLYNHCTMYFCASVLFLSLNDIVSKGIAEKNKKAESCTKVD
ncbi:unnamed protein product, partial [Echinostoma caproni]